MGAIGHSYRTTAVSLSTASPRRDLPWA